MKKPTGEVDFTRQQPDVLLKSVMQKDLHKIQASILRELLFHTGSSFTKLNRKGLTNDHFTFHLRQLTKNGIIKKKGKEYLLTQLGKSFANKLDVDSLIMERFGTPGVAVTAKKVINGKVHFLMHHRLKEPLYGYWGFINGKIRFGEFSKDTAKRELYEESGLIGNPKIVSVTHKMRGPSRKEIKLDHFFFLYIADGVKGELKNTIEGKNYWKTIEEMKKLKTFPGFDLYIEAVIKGGVQPYTERFIKVRNI